MPEKTIRLTYTPKEAQSIVLADFLEENPPAGWTRDQSDAVTRDARQFFVNENAHDFLLGRARLLVARIQKQSTQNLPTLVTPPTTIYAIFVGILTISGFIGGTLTDRLANPSAAINLLSPPIWAVFAWNALMIVVSLGLFCKIPMPWHPLQQALAMLLLSAPNDFRATGSHSPQSRWIFLFLPSYIWKTRSALHFAAAAFGLGFITSCLLRGIATAYMAGWESTWFAGHPETIAGILHWLYGWLPDTLLGLQPMPDAQQLAAMDLTQHPGVPGAPWLARVIWITVFVIVLPRLALAAASFFRALQLQNRLVLTYPAEKIVALTTCATPTDEKTLLIWCCRRPEEFSPAPNQSCLDTDPWSGLHDGALHRMNLSSFTKITVIMDPSTTPEVEVHGAFLAAVLQKATHAQLLLDFSRFDQRFAQNPERRKSRRALWENFAAQCQIPLITKG